MRAIRAAATPLAAFTVDRAPDLVTASASGLEPHVSPAAALWQVERVARARRIPADDVRALALRHVEEPLLGLLGAPRVNVLALNLALDGVGR